ncbi:MAG: hypothetical protein FWD12_09465, partial [Alphaproteobacteria bacterium]|nr:hypothetical protein [Alphaproteobacteria bacterium]
MSLPWSSICSASHHDRAAFSCVEPALDSYLQWQAPQDIRRRAAQVFAALGDPSEKIAGYYSLSAASFEKDLAVGIPDYRAGRDSGSPHRRSHMPTA